KSDWLLGEHRSCRIRTAGRRCDRSGTWGNSACSWPSCRRGHHTAWLPSILAHDPGSVETARSYRLACAAFSSAQGMGICWHLLRDDGGNCIGGGARRGGEQSHLGSHRRSSHARFVGASTAKPYPGRALSRKKL